MIERIEYQVAGRAYSGILFRAHSAVRGGVLVFHGGGGLTEHDRGVASRLADLGYIAFAPDLFGEEFSDRARGRSKSPGATTGSFESSG